MVGRDTEDLLEHLDASVQTYALVAAGTLIAAAVFGGTVAGRMLYPLRRLREATQDFGPEDMTQRVEVRGGADDVTLLMKTFNTMLERLDEGAQQQQKFLDDAGHELRTPLTILRGHLELVSVDDPADVTATREVLLDEVDRMQRLVDDLLLLANAGRPDFLRKQYVRFPEFLQQVMEKVHVLADRHWQLDGSADSVLEADPQRLTQALVQLAANAVKYTGPSSTIALGSRLESSMAPDGWPLPDGSPAPEMPPPEADTLLLWVRDTGTGIAMEDQQRIFERFGRAHPGRGQEGSGLGLAIVSAIAEAHGGTAGVESEFGSGSRFLIRIPLQSVGARL
jgi:signal transduction histidine kinase